MMNYIYSKFPLAPSSLVKQPSVLFPVLINQSKSKGVSIFALCMILTQNLRHARTLIYVEPPKRRMGILVCGLKFPYIQIKVLPPF